MLQYVNSFIDTVQGAKTSFVKQFIQDETIAKSLQSFVDAQTTFVKQVAKTGFDVGTKTVENVSKFDILTVSPFKQK